MLVVRLFVIYMFYFYINGLVVVGRAFFVVIVIVFLEMWVKCVNVVIVGKDRMFLYCYLGFVLIFDW